MGRETSRTDVGRQWNSLSSSEAMQAMQKMLASLERHADEAGKNLKCRHFIRNTDFKAQTTADGVCMRPRKLRCPQAGCKQMLGRFETFLASVVLKENWAVAYFWVVDLFGLLQ